MCAVWFVVYLTLSFLLDAVDRGGNKTAFGYFDLVAPSVSAVVSMVFGSPDRMVEMEDVSMIDMIPPR